MICQECGEEFERTNDRGRIPKRCNSCRGKPKTTSIKEKKPTPKEIVDRLELNLKSRGTHISQQKEKW